MVFHPRTTGEHAVTPVRNRTGQGAFIPATSGESDSRNGSETERIAINREQVHVTIVTCPSSWQTAVQIISPTTLFLAAKVEEQPRKLEHVIKVAHACLNPQELPLDTKSNAYLQQAQELVILESIVLQTLGFEITIDHPHTDVVKCSQLVRASKDLAQTSYYMATNSLLLTTFCLQYKPTVIACVCIHLACKWSNWEIPVSTDGKHWWEYVDNSVTLELLDELTHEFLQILEKTPSRLKRIRNWRATQAAKKPKTETAQMGDNSFVGPSILQEHNLSDSSLPGVSFSNPNFSKSGSAFPVSMPGQSGGVPLSLDAMAGTYNPSCHSEWPQGNQSQAVYLSTCLKQDSVSVPHQGPTLPLPTSTSSLLHHPPLYKTEKMDFNPVKHEQKGAGGSVAGKHQLAATQLPPPQPSPAQKLSLEKYREKHVAELVAAGQKRRQEQHGGLMECDAREDSSSISTCAPFSASQLDHRKHSQTHQISQHAYGSSSISTASPMKKVPSHSSTGQDRRHHSDKRDKGASSLKLRLAVPGSASSSQLDKSGQLSKDDLKMKLKVSSSERNSSSDEGMAANNKSKHSSPLVSKDKQYRGAEHASHRHHKHSHGHTHSGNGRGGPEGHGGGGVLLQSPLGLVSMERAPAAPVSTTSSSRKRPHAEVNHHPSSSSSSSCSKVSKISKGSSVAAGGLRTSQQYPPSDLSHELGDQRH
ncbi:cyclin-T2a isoform X2 [Thalassophryne amazonica]|uniref:cyclin-T2a isoform X2 n=1 Tax=Thalassophryne amazonica TaxID=390379 RepID=UPI0014710374|nr:cyclin-T2a isoform X2 [Thalassophryne amazonica]